MSDMKIMTNHSYIDELLTFASDSRAHFSSLKFRIGVKSPRRTGEEILASTRFSKIDKLNSTGDNLLALKQELSGFPYIDEFQEQRIALLNWISEKIEAVRARLKEEPKIIVLEDVRMKIGTIKTVDLPVGYSLDFTGPIFAGEKTLAETKEYIEELISRIRISNFVGENRAEFNGRLIRGARELLASI